MASISQKFQPDHPLLADRGRLDQILDAMYAKIQKILFPSYPGRRPKAEVGEVNNTGALERILEGTGVSADDILSQAFLALLAYPPERLERTWEGLAVTIARNKAIDALRASKKGLRGTDHRHELRLLSSDAEREASEGEMQPALLKVLPSKRPSPEDEYLEMEYVVELRNLARDVLDERSQKIFFAIHFEEYTRGEVGEQLGLTSQRIGQIYRAALRRLQTHINYPSPSDLDN